MKLMTLLKEIKANEDILPLPKTKVLAHVAGPSGSGKTEIMNSLKPHLNNIVMKDIDEFDEEAVEKLDWKNIPKNSYTDEMLKKLFKCRQMLIDNYISANEKHIIFVGHHIESGLIHNLQNSINLLINVNPRTSALRRYKRYSYSKKRLNQDINIGRNDVEELKNLNYIPMSSSKIYKIILNWDKDLNNKKNDR